MDDSDPMPIFHGCEEHTGGYGLGLSLHLMWGGVARFQDALLNVMNSYRILG